MKIAELLEILEHTDTVTFKLTGVGEESYSTHEIHTCITDAMSHNITLKEKQ